VASAIDRLGRLLLDLLIAVDHIAALTLRNMQQSYERYLALARGESQNGNTIAAENYYQHAEHYFRSMFSNES
jgi:hypothetical protein